MDTSDEYIAMCRHAREIQEIWQPEDGDFFYYNTAVETIGRYTDFLCPVDYVQEYPVSQKDCVWLPRLDQLVDLVREHYINISTIQQSAIRVLCSLFDCEHNISLLHSIQTPEQYILSELYQEKYSKWWNGEDWK